MIIRLINTNLGKAGNYETEADTWGELQTEDFVQEYLSGNSKAIIRENQNSLETDQAALPSESLTGEDKEYDYSLFFVTKKSKAGSDQYDDLGFNELRRECASRETIQGVRGNYGSSTEMRDLLRQDDESNQSCQGSSDQLDRIESKIDAIAESLPLLTLDAQEETGPTEEELSVYENITSQL